MKNKKRLRSAALLLAATLLVGSVPIISDAAAPKLSTRNSTIKVGSKKTIKVKNATGKVKWSIKTGKQYINAKFYAKKAVITGRKKGKAVIIAKTGKKTLKCTITVKPKGVTPPTPTVEYPIIEDGTETAAADFALDLIKELRTKDKENTLISPDSIMTALIMAGYGAKGDTLADMEKTLKIKNMDDAGNFFGTLHKRLGQSQISYYSAADSIWAREGEVTLKDDFINKNKETLGADIYTEPFNADTVKKINFWVNKNTKGMIPEIINELGDDSLVVLLNAVCFEGQWAHAYSDYQVDKNGTFTTKDGKKKTVTMLNSTEKYYIELAGGTGFVKYYSDNDYAFVALLPPENEDVDTYIAKLSGSELVSACKNPTYTTVYTQTPEFKYDYQAELKDALSNMGMKKAFTAEADFSDMGTPNSDKYVNMHIDKVIHKTHIELDQNGTKAAAATAVEVETSAYDPELPKEVYLDRPFVYSIIDTATGMPLFLGTVDNIGK